MTITAKRHVCLALLTALFFPGFAWACTCADRDSSAEDQKKGRLANAGIVAKGRMISASVGRDIVWPKSARFGDNIGSSVGPAPRPISAQFQIAEAIKGEISGQVTLWSGPGFGECGIGGALIGAAIQDLDVSLELVPVEGSPNQYAVDMCGYMDAERPEPPNTKP